MRGGVDVQFRGVERETKGRADTRTEGLGIPEREHTSVVDLRLNERSLVEVAKQNILKVSSL